MNSLTQLVGQDRAVELLSRAIKLNRIAPAYLFSGPSGVGRSLAARCFSELLICQGIGDLEKTSIQKRLRANNHPDRLWVEPTYLHQKKLLSATEAAAMGLKRKASPQIRIEQVREITQFLSRPPLEATRSIVVIEDAQTMREAAANALLKTLEEPGKATLILIATPNSLLPTLVSRTQQIPFYRLSEEDLKQVLRQNNYQEILEQKDLLAIAQGSPGDAIASFSQLEAIPSELLDKLKQSPQTSLEALQLAKEIDDLLDTQAQLWLANYLQYYYWNRYFKKSVVELLEKTRHCLLSYVQPRLVWENTFLKLFADR
ncbi:MAG: DNA polymerase III subunit delta' [Prochloraceae cyanobacterium]|nr:DNA polymerase III subunit delta' [Prochloraceae cyanobacterium]